jgi:hypothetical protein
MPGAAPEVGELAEQHLPRLRGGLGVWPLEVAQVQRLQAGGGRGGQHLQAGGGSEWRVVVLAVLVLVLVEQAVMSYGPCQGLHLEPKAPSTDARSSGCA